MLISKQKLLEIIDQTIIKTCEACGKSLSFEERFGIKLAIFMIADWGINGTNQKASTKATYKKL